MVERARRGPFRRRSLRPQPAFGNRHLSRTFEWPVARLSTGERQRLALARALQPGTRVLLLDEPASGLDAASVGMVEALLRRQLAAGTSIVLVTHYREQEERR